MSKKKIPGKQYEQIVADIHKQFSGAADITLNEKIIGKSGVVRQIDVSLRSSVVGYSVLIIVECKDYKRKVDVGCVDELIGKIDDVAAQGGVLISDSQFTTGAINRAKSFGRIQLCSVVDSSNGKIRSKLYMPLKVSFSNVQIPYEVGLTVTSSVEAIAQGALQFDQENPTDQKELCAFINERGADFIGAFLRWIAQETANLPSGEYTYERTINENPKLTVKILCRFTKTLRSFINENIYADAVGIYDHLSKSFVKGQIKSTKLVEEQIVQTWREVAPNFKVKDGTPHYIRVNSCSEKGIADIVEALLQKFVS